MSLSYADAVGFYSLIKLNSEIRYPNILSVWFRPILTIVCTSSDRWLDAPLSSLILPFLHSHPLGLDGVEKNKDYISSPMRPPPSSRRLGFVAVFFRTLTCSSGPLAPRGEPGHGATRICTELKKGCSVGLEGRTC